MSSTALARVKLGINCNFSDFFVKYSYDQPVTNIFFFNTAKSQVSANSCSILMYSSMVSPSLWVRWWKQVLSCIVFTFLSSSCLVCLIPSRDLLLLPPLQMWKSYTLVQLLSHANIAAYRPRLLRPPSWVSWLHGSVEIQSGKNDPVQTYLQRVAAIKFHMRISFLKTMTILSFNLWYVVSVLFNNLCT